LVILCGAAVYANSLEGTFVFDDLEAISNNPSIRDLSAIRRVLSPPRGTTVSGRPLINVTLAINYALGGLNVLGYHLLNITIHLLAGLTLFGVVRRTLLLPRMHLGRAYPATVLALVIGLIWVVHPLNTEAVTYIIQRAESMMGLFYLLTLYCVIRGAGARHPALWYGAGAMVCALGMACKEVMVTAPIIVLLFDRVFLAESWRQVFRQRWGLYIALTATLVVMAILVMGTEFRAQAIGQEQSRLSWSYALMQPGNILHYLRLSFWPDPLVLHYGRELDTNQMRIVPQWIAVAGLLLGTMLMLAYRPPIGFLGAWFFIILSPSSSIVRLIQKTHEHRMYLSLAAVVTLIVLVGYGVLFRGKNRKPWHKVAMVAVLIVIVAALGARTMARNATYRTEISLWQDNIQNLPDTPRPYSNLGTALARQGKFDQAMAMFNKALAINEKLALAYNNRGTVYMDMGQMDRAVADFNQAIKLDPRILGAHFNRGIIAANRGHFAMALRDFEQVIALRPDYLRTYYHRGKALGALGKCQQAIADFSRSIEHRYMVGASLHNRAICYYLTKQYDLAWSDVKQARAIGHELPSGFINSLTEASGRSD
jgi:Tfp pilus assembly protein PilF